MKVKPVFRCQSRGCDPEKILAGAGFSGFAELYAQDDPTRALLDRLQGVTKNGDGWTARCPCGEHPDKHPSMSIAYGTTQISSNGKHNVKTLKLHETENGVRGALLWSVRQKHPDAAIKATYTYHNTGNTVAFKVLRFDWPGGKDVRPYRPADGGWVARGLPNGRPLYRANELGDGARMFVVEGEPCADETRSLGLPCVTSAGGSKAASKSDWTPLARFDEVVIVPDQDRPGESYALDVARILVDLGIIVRIVRLPGLSDGEDLVDFVHEHRDGRTADEIAAEINALAEATEAWSPPEPDGEHEPDAAPLHDDKSPVNTEIGNAERFMRQHGDDVLWCPALGWLTWDGKRWRRDESARVLRLAKQTARSILQEALIREGEQQKMLLAHWRKSEGRSRIKAMIKLAEPEAAVQASAFDRDRMLLNVANGTIDLRTGELRDHRRDDRITKASPVRFDPVATCPTFEQFIRDVFLDRDELVSFYQRLLGYTLTGMTTDQGLYLLFGRGENGKSQLLNVQRALLGDYGLNCQSETFMIRNAGSIREDVARLAGARMVVSTETEEGRQLAETFVKQFTGEDDVTARFLYRPSFEFKPACKIFVACNHKPVICGTDHAIWRRIRLIPFDWKVPSDKKVEGFAEKRLKPELNGILNWAIRGCLEWQRDGLHPPECVRAATADYRAESDVLAEWIGERCNVGPDNFASNKALRKSCEAWANENGIRPMDGRWFGRRLAERSGLVNAKSGGERGWHGISVRAGT